jgi:release factor glutamine methyltransferase
LNRREALDHIRKILDDNHIADAALEGEILLRHALELDRTQLLTDLDEEVNTADLKALTNHVNRRIRGEPSAYIVGSKEFFGLDFIVNRNVLIPRPETELLVEKAIGLCQDDVYSLLADIGTGCGAIAVSLAVSLPKVSIFATDISALALEVARQNAGLHDVRGRIAFLQGDLLAPLPEPVDMIIANMPYVREADMAAVGTSGYEPKLALDGGKKGLDKISLLCSQAVKKLKKNGSLLLEIGQGQAAAVRSILHKYFPAGAVEVEKDLAGIERVVSLRLT